MAEGNSIAGLKVVIIGSGFAGTLMAIKLLERGVRDFVVLEKADRLGGTWRDNTYPGAACDVAAHLYSYSFARNPWWPSRYAKGPAIWKYHARVARRFGVLPFIRYGQEVTEVTFDGRGWVVRTAAGDAYHADVVVCATGRLHHPVVPAIAGGESFAGASFHTARWDHSVPLTGKRVGLIGTGSTATQVITALAGQVSRLSVFQRTAQWVFPVKDTPNPWRRRLQFALSPAVWKRYYLQLRGETEARAVAATGTPEGRAARDQAVHDALASIRDPELRARLTPDYEVGCKRLVFSDGFYDAIQQPSIDLVTTPIDRIVPEGVVTADGRTHPLDVLVYATGFDAHAYLRPMRITGVGGITLDQVWADLPLTYQSMTIPGMPNLLLINGPYSPGGSASVIGIIEAQVEYLLKLLDRIATRNVLLDPRADVALAWLEGVREKARASVWGSGGCQSWYLDKTGTPSLDPSTLSELSARLAQPAWSDYIETPRAGQEAS
ncbi:MAG: NAD(P)/FAD-dependent oxidoreductase [Sphingomonadales bacterium]|nr:NAD(P)/FAD-dependent oxidoreductase [Sphingomonadales bacterium]